MSRYEITPAADDDLAEILSFIAEGSLEAAESFEQRLDDVFSRLADTPGIGHRRDDLTTLDLRFWPVESYLIVYQPGTSPLKIVRVLSGYRDVADILAEGE